MIKKKDIRDIAAGTQLTAGNICKEEIIIDARDIEYGYQGADECAICGISLQVKQGEFLAILGHNGSGKSTLAKMFNALFIPSAGELKVCGLDVLNPDDTWEIRQRVSMVFQNPDNQIVATIVEEDVAFGLENLGLPPDEIRSRVYEALRLVGMENYALAAPHMLSGGQKQRVAIAGIIAMRPQVIVLDESTSMLDPNGRSEVMEIIKKMNSDAGMTVIWITHDMDEAARADRVIVMNQGDIAMTGTPIEIFNRSGELRGLGLDVPPMVAFREMIAQKGITIAEDILDVDAMADELLRQYEQMHINTEDACQ